MKRFFDFLDRYPALPWIGVLACMVVVGYVEYAK